MKFLFFVLIFFSGLSVYSQQEDKPYLVILSMDGFRWDYPDSFPTPNLHRFAAHGVKAQSLIPSFPSVTFPNHYTLATGLYPDHHGIVNNTFFDSVLHRTYRISDRTAVEDGTFYGGEPIWNTAEKQHVRTACFYWVGSEAPIQNMHSSYWKSYDKNITFEQRIDTVIYWLSLPEKSRPHLIMFYYDQPDKSGHSYGPFSTETRKVVIYLDSLVGVLMNKIDRLPNARKINVVLTSDHGMEYIDPAKKIVLNKYVPLDRCEHIAGHNPLYTLDAKAGFSDSLLADLRGVPHLKVWKKSEVPSYLHFGTNPRIGEFVLLADSSYSLVLTGNDREGLGTHGYDTRNTDMHAIFYAAGPAFRKGYVFPSFENVNVYPLMAHILMLKPAKNDGDLTKVKDMLNPDVK